MKRFLSLFLVLTMVLGVFSACGSKEKGVKTGLAVVTSLSSSQPADADMEGNAQSDSVAAAVLVGEDGKLIKAVLDTAQTKIAFDDKGALVTPVDTEFKTKRELGDDYGMRDFSGIGKEWNEQAAFFTDYLVGKTAKEIKGLAIDESSVPTDADLLAGVTVHVGDYMEAIVKAMNEAVVVGANADDKLGLGIVTNMGSSLDASAGVEGLAQAYSSYAAVTVDGSGVISSALLDASQSNINFDDKGQISTDLTTRPETKHELGDKYNMKPASPIGKEWNEQADALAAFYKGKTIDQVTGMALAEGAPSDEDLKASVTITVGDLNGALERAYNTAA